MGRTFAEPDESGNVREVVRDRGAAPHLYERNDRRNRRTAPGSARRNAARLALMNLEGYEPAPVARDELPIEDRWIIDGLDRTIGLVTSALEQYQFAEAARQLRDFTWGDFCDWYLEFVKGRLRDPAARPVAQRVLAALLDGLSQSHRGQFDARHLESGRDL